jgi:FlaA1/EpsC-like NDP-sugar epimerase
MGECVKIVDLARRMIELSGLRPEKDIKIKFSGIRAGEKEYEELITEDENIEKSTHEKIMVLKKNGTNIVEVVNTDKILELIANNDSHGLRLLAKEYVPENTFADSCK